MASTSQPAHAPPGRAGEPTLRRRLVLDAIGMSLSATAFGLVYGLAARTAGFTPVEAVATSILVLAGASQFAAVGLVAGGAPWAAIVLLTALLNARHLLYSAALAPWLAATGRIQRAAMAHAITDESFGLAIAHFRRVGRADVRGFWLAAAFVCLPWVVATGIGAVGAGAIPEPRLLGLDVVFPAAMAGLAAALIHERPDLVAAIVGAAAGLAVGLAVDPSVGIVAGGLSGPVAGMAIGGRRLAPRGGPVDPESVP